METLDLEMKPFVPLPAYLEFNNRQISLRVTCSEARLSQEDSVCRPQQCSAVIDLSVLRHTAACCMYRRRHRLKHLLP
ncbi:hypothetical protein ACOMHN_062060 [Nucella lapillus]